MSNSEYETKPSFQLQYKENNMYDGLSLKQMDILLTHPRSRDTDAALKTLYRRLKVHGLTSHKGRRTAEAIRQIKETGRLDVEKCFTVGRQKKNKI